MDALKLYGLSQQAFWGDNDQPEPSYFYLLDNYKWHAWTEFKGMSQDDAKEEFIEFAEK